MPDCQEFRRPQQTCSHPRLFEIMELRPALIQPVIMFHVDKTRAISSGAPLCVQIGTAAASHYDVEYNIEGSVGRAQLLIYPLPFLPFYTLNPKDIHYRFTTKTKHKTRPQFIARLTITNDAFSQQIHYMVRCGCHCLCSSSARTRSRESYVHFA